ncbi:DUF2339 domain-containing protein [Prevotella sp. 10(H)]|uniref:DUF2339 domain-containing protein n=1 Tax=Prevotella sp. 10(H) TaxID=1158294 RepID=UPI0004A72179|nr:DUF2339 domain-containing protein [Prevotella sp. 10(H)]
MEGFLVFLLIIVLISIFIIPIILLVKMSSISQNIDYISRDVNNLNKRLTDLHNHTASVKDLDVIMDALDEINNKSKYAPESPVFHKETEDKPVTISPEEIFKEEIIAEAPVPETIVKEQSQPEINELIEQEPEPIVEEVIVEEIIPESIVETVMEENIDEQPQEELASESNDEQTAEEETPPPFAAFVRNEEEEKVTAEIPPVQVPPVSPPPPIHVDEEPEDEYEDKNFIEKLLGDNWLSKVGIVTLVLGIGFFVKYAIDQNWINEVGRVGIGILTGGIIIGIAHKLKLKYHVFSSILVGGGISVFYITITLAFREYQLFNQTIAFIILIAITIFSVILSLYYDRKELAIFSLLGGFASPLMVSTGTGNYIVLFSYILILNSGMLVVSFVKKWRVIGIISYVLTLIFFWTWTLRYFENQFIPVTIFAVLFFVQFYLLALFDHFKAESKITAYQAFLILTNNLSVFLACIYVFDNYEYDVRGLVTIAIAVVNAIVMLALFRQSKVDRNLIYMIIAMVMTFVSLAIPMQLHGHVITMFWGAEVVLLLWLWQMSNIKVFRVGFLVIAVLTLISYAMDVNHNYMYDEALPFFVNRIFITGLVVIASFIINMFLLKKEDPDSDIELTKFDTISVGAVTGAFKFVVVILTYIVPYLELNYQLELYTDTGMISSFRCLALATYTSVYIAVLGAIYRKTVVNKAHIFILLFFSVILYTFVYSYLAIDLRFDIFSLNAYGTSYFVVHLISLPAIAYIIFLLARNVKALSEDWFSPLCWSLVIMSVAIMSIELDNLVIQLFGNVENYEDLLYDVHTFGYPILWGIIAMVLMVWGLKSKEVLLRKISLIFFGVIIIKFYAYDVWRMSQAGRIVSFIMLGVILLLVSFMQQKIKVLVKDDKPSVAEDHTQEQE